MKLLWRMRSFFLGMALVGTVVGTSLYVRSTVDEHLEVAQRPWRLWLDELPPWFPPTYRGRVADLDRIPEQVSLKPPAWRDRLTSALLANPWIEEVHELKREGERIAFSAAFARPVVAVAAVGGFLLLDIRGCVIDFQPGSDLNEAWRVALFHPENGPMTRLAPGQRLRGDEFVELTSLVELLWDARIFDRWPGAVEDILSEPRAGEDRFWVLEIDGCEVEWGRAPASPRISPLGPAAKLKNLRTVLENRQRLGGTRSIELWSDREPLIVDRR